MREAGKTLDDLREAVERQQVEKQIAAADTVLADAEQSHAEVAGPLQARLAEIRDASWAAESAKNQLIQTCTDPALLTLARDVESQLVQWRRDASTLRNVISDFRDRARNEHALAEQAQRIVHGEERMNEHPENAKRHERSAAGCEAQLILAEKAITRLERQEHSIRDQMLVA